MESELFSLNVHLVFAICICLYVGPAPEKLLEVHFILKHLLTLVVVELKA